MTQFFGHLHPLLVHLPIGLIVLLAILEGLARNPRFKNANASARFILILAVPMALFTALCGWLLSLGGSYGDRLLQWHQWTGLGTAAASAFVGLLYWLDLKKLYRICLFSTLLVLIITSHFGGSLTHGSDYLVRYVPKPLLAFFGNRQTEIKIKNIPEMQVFSDIVQPILRQDCVPCHGPEKSESELRLDSLTALLKGGKSGPVLVAGKSAKSTLLKRLRLPLPEKEHMPPEGKPQPDTDQISLLQWWIDSGAPADKTIAQLRPPIRILRSVQARYGSSAIANNMAPKPLPAVQPLLTKIGDDLHISITALSPNEPWLQCNAAIAGTNFGDAELAKLAPLSANLRWLDLSGTNISDAGLAQFAAMPNLVRLHLERTAVTDAGLGRLATLPQLEYLNLYATGITDAGLERLPPLPTLKQLHLWRTKVTPAAAKSFAEAFTDTNQLQQWRSEIDQLKARIKNGHFLLDLGAPAATPSTNSAAVNALCPVSGKPVDPSRTVNYEGTLVAFCCDDCKAKFQHDPKPLLAKLGLISNQTKQTKNN